VNIRQVQAFVLVAELGSFNGEAELLWLEASTVTKLVKRLERDLGVVLLHRTTRHVRLADEGRAALQPARQLLTASLGLQQVVARANDTGAATTIAG
jgi:DNA-binding transcriptional LysR family regulator